MSFRQTLTRAENYISEESQVPLDETVLGELKQHLEEHPKILKAIRDAVSSVLARGNMTIGSVMMVDIWCDIFLIVSGISIGLTGIAIANLRRQKSQLRWIEENIEWQLAHADRCLAEKAAGDLSLRSILGDAGIHYRDFDTPESFRND